MRAVPICLLETVKKSASSSSSSSEEEESAGKVGYEITIDSGGSLLTKVTASGWG
jgi:hypothetical protein